MVGSCCPGGTLAKVAGDQLWFGYLLSPQPAFTAGFASSSVANRQGDLDWRKIPISLIDPDFWRINGASLC